MEFEQQLNGLAPIRVGCLGYSYKHWRGVFYPEKLPTTRWLEHYSQHFMTVELNNTFYTLPGQKTFEFWRDRTPLGFVFSVKASRFITHMKKLKEPQEQLANFLEKARLLEAKLGPILYQLPPRWRFDPARLEAFLQLLPPDLQHTIEVRDTSWLNERFFGLLEQYRVAYCITSLPIYQTPIIATASFVYFRCHGSGQMYYYNYTRAELERWRDEIVGLAGQGLPVYCYFDNDPEGWAVQNALDIIQLLGSPNILGHGLASLSPDCQ